MEVGKNDGEQWRTTQRRKSEEEESA